MNWFCNLKISKKLILSFILVSLITGIMGVYAIIQLKFLDNSDTELYEHMTDIVENRVSELKSSSAFDGLISFVDNTLLGNKSDNLNSHPKLLETYLRNSDFHFKTESM